jgi:serine/threonine protein kinase
LKSYSKKIDIYATGIVLYYMLVGKHPLFVMGDTQTSYKKKVTTLEPTQWFYPDYVSP